MKGAVLVLAAGAMAAGCATSKAAHTDGPAPQITIAVPQTTAASSTTRPSAPTFDSLVSASGALYAVTRDRDLVEVALSDGRSFTEPIPDDRLAAADGIVALPEGVVVFHREGSAAAAFPFDLMQKPEVVE